MPSRSSTLRHNNGPSLKRRRGSCYSALTGRYPRCPP
jgi:hypothetical protein